jgi:hypothetical protein
MPVGSMKSEAVKSAVAQANKVGFRRGILQDAGCLQNPRISKKEKHVAYVSQGQCAFVHDDNAMATRGNYVSHAHLVLRTSDLIAHDCSSSG